MSSYFNVSVVSMAQQVDTKSLCDSDDLQNSFSGFSTNDTQKVSAKLDQNRSLVKCPKLGKTVNSLQVVKKRPIK